MTPYLLVTALGRVELVELGSGPPVLILHGTPGDWRQARVLAEDLSATHRVLLPSRPGYGTTPLSVGRSPQQQAEAYRAVLDTLGLDRSAVIGISGGGPSARAFAAHQRERCSALVLCCAVAPHLLTIPVGMRLLGALPGLWQLGARLSARRAGALLEDGAAARAQVLAGLGPAERAVVLEDPRAMSDLLDFARARVGAQTQVAGLRNDVGWFARAVEPAPWPAGPVVPTLVLSGDHDNDIPLAHSEHHRDSIPGAVLEVIPGAGHAFAISLRRQISARIATFLAGA